MKHTTGSISVAELYTHMIEKYGPNVDFLDVFVSTHTTPGAPDQPPQWIDQMAETTFNAYKTAVEAEVAEGQLECTGEKVSCSGEIWEVVASQGQKKKGKRLYGLGERGGLTLKPSASSFSGSPSTARSHPSGESMEVELLKEKVARQEQEMAEQRQMMVEQRQLIEQMHTFVMMQQQHQPPSSFLPDTSSTLA